MSKNDKKVIGYIASFSRTEVLFVGDACLVMGSEKKLQHHLSINAPEQKSKAKIKKYVLAIFYALLIMMKKLFLTKNPLIGFIL